MQMYPDLKLKTAAYASGDEAIAKLRGGFRADVINLCAEESAATAVRLKLVQPLDTSRIKDWNRIFPAFYKLPGVTAADGKHYMVPVDAGVTGIIYNKDCCLHAAHRLQGPLRPQVPGQGGDPGLPGRGHRERRAGAGLLRPHQPHAANS